MALPRAERERIVAALSQTGGNRTKAAELLGRLPAVALEDLLALGERQGAEGGVCHKLGRQRVAIGIAACGAVEADRRTFVNGVGPACMGCRRLVFDHDDLPYFD